MILVAAFTMRFRTGENQYCGNHNGSSAQTQGAHILAAAITMRFAACHNHCFANHNGSNAQNRRGPQRRQRAPQPLLQSLETAPATAERAGPPAATTRAAAPSAVSGVRRPQRAPQPLLQSLETAPATAERAGPPAATTRPTAPSAVSGDCAGHCGESRAPSGDNAPHSPFCSLWTLRRPLRREPGPQRRQRAPQPGAPRQASQTSSPQYLQCDSQGPLRREPGPPRRQRAPQPLLQSLDTAPATAERAGPPAATTRAAAPSAGHCGESRAPSGDNARRRPLCSLWTLRRPLQREPGPQRRQRAPQPLLQSLDTAERARPPAATTRAEGPFGGSGYCAGHCGESRAPSGDNARRSPFWRLWILRRPLRM